MEHFSSVKTIATHQHVISSTSQRYLVSFTRAQKTVKNNNGKIRHALNNGKKNIFVFWFVVRFNAFAHSIQLDSKKKNAFLTHNSSLLFPFHSLFLFLFCKQWQKCELKSFHPHYFVSFFVLAQINKLASSVKMHKNSPVRSFFSFGSRFLRLVFYRHLTTKCDFWCRKKAKQIHKYYFKLKRGKKCISKRNKHVDAHKSLEQFIFLFDSSRAPLKIGHWSNNENINDFSCSNERKSKRKSKWTSQKHKKNAYHKLNCDKNHFCAHAIERRENKNIYFYCMFVFDGNFFMTFHDIFRSLWISTDNERNASPFTSPLSPHIIDIGFPFSLLGIFFMSFFFFIFVVSLRFYAKIKCRQRSAEFILYSVNEMRQMSETVLWLHQQ